MNTPVSIGTTTGQQVVVKNTGVLRLLGTQLIAQAKISNWVFYLEDIKSMIVYADDGTDTWFGTLGQPAAGSLAVRDSLVPFEGQRFYVVEQDIAYEYKGGSWEGTVFEGNTVSPVYVNVSESTTLAVGRKYLITGNTAATYTLQASNAKDGHEIEVVTNRTDNGAVLTVSEGTLNFAGQVVTSVIVKRSNSYNAVRFNDIWYVFASPTEDALQRSANLSDVESAETSRSNLGVNSSEESTTELNNALDAIIVARGIKKSGTAEEGTLTFEPDYATPEEAENPSIEDKVVSPATISTAVTGATKANPYNNITGIFQTTTQPKFAMTLNSDPADNKIDITEFTGIYNPEPFVRNQPLNLVTYEASTLTLPPGTGVEVHYIVAYDNGTIVTQFARPVRTAVDRILLGFTATLNGSVIIVAGEPSITAEPWLSSSDYNIRIAQATAKGGALTPSTTVGTVAIGLASYEAESANWENSTSDPHRTERAAQDPMEFTAVDRNGAIISAIGETEIDGETLDDGTTVGNNNYSIQVIYMLPEGALVNVIGQQIYPNFQDAYGQIYVYNPQVTDALLNAVEIGRILLKGDQYPGNGGLDLTQSANATFFTGRQVTGGANSTVAANISAETANNYLHSSSVQLMIDELSRMATFIPLTTGNIQVSNNYLCNFAGSKAFPLSPVLGDVIGLTRKSTDPVPTFSTPGPEQFYLLSVADNLDDEFELDLAGTPIFFVFDGTNWGAINA